MAAFTQHDVDQAYAQGFADGVTDGLPFQGVDVHGFLGGVRFLRDRPHFAAAAIYERDLMVHRARMREWLGSASVSEDQAHDDALAAAQGARERVASAGGSNRVTAGARRTVARVQSDNDRQRVQAHFEESSQRRQGLESLVGHLTVELDEVRRWLDHHVDAAAAYADERATRRSFDDEP